MSEQPESRLDQAERLIKELAESDIALGKRLEELAAQDKLRAERHDDFDAKMEVLRVNIESLHSSVSELYATAQKDGENIRALARIAEIHERRLTDLEGNAS